MVGEKFRDVLVVERTKLYEVKRVSLSCRVSRSTNDLRTVFREDFVIISLAKVELGTGVVAPSLRVRGKATDLEHEVRVSAAVRRVGLLRLGLVIEQVWAKTKSQLTSTYLNAIQLSIIFNSIDDRNFDFLIRHRCVVSQNSKVSAVTSTKQLVAILINRSTIAELVSEVSTIDI